MNLIYGCVLQRNVNPSVWYFWGVACLREVGVWNATLFELAISNLNLLLEFKTLKTLLSKTTSWGCLFRANVEVKHEVGLDKPTIST
jgi:hypothetical protein